MKSDTGGLLIKDPVVENKCPTCGESAEATCRCFRRDSTCKNGHMWHTCTMHRVLVPGHSDHGLDTYTCTCGLGASDGRRVISSDEKSRRI